MNDSFAQHAAQTPSPATGSRQATHSVGSAMSSASRAACDHAPCGKAPARRADGRRWQRRWRGLGVHRARLALPRRGGSSTGIAREWRDRRTNRHGPEPRYLPRVVRPRPAACSAGAGAAVGRGDFPDRSSSRGYGGTAAGGAARISRMSPISARRAKSCARRWPAASARSQLSIFPISKASVSRSPLRHSTSRYRRWRFSSSTICRACSRRSAGHCRPDGLLLAAMIGGDTLTELRQSFAAAEAECEGGVSPRVAPFADLRDLGALLQRAGFALAGHRRRPRRRALRQRIRTDAGSPPHGRDQRADRAAARRPRAARRCCAWRRSTANVLRTPTAASAPPSISSGCPAGRRTRASKNR